MSSKLVKGAAIIGMAGVIVKILGAFFRIPLANWIGDTGMSYYGFAYSIYGALLVLATAGLPVAISRLVSENIAQHKYKNAHKVFHVSFRLMLAIGMVSFLICFFGSGLLASIFKNPDAALAVKAISPALLFVPLFSAFRGYFQGRQNMNPTAISEVTEQLVRVIAGLTLAWVLLHGAYEEPEVQAAAGASFGASAGSVAGLGIIFIIYLLNRRVIHRKIDLNSDAVEETKVIIKKIVVIAVPIIIGAEVMPIMNLLDTAIIMRRLQETGWTLEEAQGMYGLISGFCSPLIAFPQIFTQAVSVSLVPAIAGYAALKNRERIQENVGLAYRTTMIMAFPCAFGMFALSEPILLLLFGAQPESAREAAPILQIMAIGVVFLAIVQTSTGILQAVGRQTLPVKHLLLGCVVKGVLTYILVGIAAVNVKGAAIGTVVAYIIAMILNNRSVYVNTGCRQNLSMAYLRPGLAAAIMAAAAYGAYLGLEALTGSNGISTLLSICVGAAVYVVLIFVFKVITVEELNSFPGGRKLSGIVRRFVK